MPHRVRPLQLNKNARQLTIEQAAAFDRLRTLVDTHVFRVARCTASPAAAGPDLSASPPPFASVDAC
jgi:hypothetical protein